MKNKIIESTHCSKEELREIHVEPNEDRIRQVMHRKINRIHHKIFTHCNIGMPDGKVLHIGRTIGMNYAKYNEVPQDDIFCMTGHTVSRRRSNVAKVHYFTHSPPTAMHAMSGATIKKE